MSKEELKYAFRRYLRKIKSKYGLESKAEKADKAAFQQALQIACRWETASKEEKSSVLNYIIG